MPIYKDDKPDFDIHLILTAKDSEGREIADAPIPANFTLEVISDNPDAFSVTQDAADLKLIHCHVGGPNADGTPATANVTALLKNATGDLVAIGSDAVTVTVGDPASISSISLTLPPA